mmetsp:Transcript_15136/g.38763  ORF Transcript_15136/g.38763 Transcript_15136/m.38763 type:complete len:379 (+) Transcript_15136:210-1346(+)
MLPTFLACSREPLISTTNRARKRICISRRKNLLAPLGYKIQLIILALRIDPSRDVKKEHRQTFNVKKSSSSQQRRINARMKTVANTVAGTDLNVAESSSPVLAVPSNAQLTALTSRWRAEQKTLRRSLILHDDALPFSLPFLPPAPLLPPLSIIAGTDISFSKSSPSVAVDTIAIFSFPSLTLLHLHHHPITITTPYIAGFLAFREVAPLRAALEGLIATHPHLTPQLLVVDGNGILHPAAFGLASHLGVLTNIPTLGVSKSPHRFPGLPDPEDIRRAVLAAPPKTLIPLLPDDMTDCDTDCDAAAPAGGWPMPRGYAVRCSANEDARNPVFVSPGHGMSVETAGRLVLCMGGFRVPEPTRLADQASREYIRVNKLGE